MLETSVPRRSPRASATEPIDRREAQRFGRPSLQYGDVLDLVEDLAEEETEAAPTRLVAQGRIDGLIIASAHPNSTAHAARQAQSSACVYVGRRLPGSGRNAALDE